MCLGIPGQIVEIVDADQNLATVEVSGVRRVISVVLLSEQDLIVGDWVLIHVGFAMAKIDEVEATLTLERVETMGRESLSEIDAFRSSQIT
jgi:hydrogenase expression/formation protein HypC